MISLPCCMQDAMPGLPIKGRWLKSNLPISLLPVCVVHRYGQVPPTVDNIRECVLSCVEQVRVCASGAACMPAKVPCMFVEASQCVHLLEGQGPAAWPPVDHGRAGTSTVGLGAVRQC